MSVLAEYVHAVDEALRERAAHVMSITDFAELYRSDPGAELIEGEVYMTPAGLYHDKIVIALASEIHQYLRKNPIGEVYGSSAGFRLTNRTVVSPDVSYVALNKLPGGKTPEEFANFPPDLAVEIVSPYDREQDTLQKADLYLQHGTRLVWVIYPRQRTAFVYLADGSMKRIQTDGSLDGDDVLPGFICKLSDIL